MRTVCAWRAALAVVCAGAMLHCGSPAVGQAPQPEAVDQRPAGLAATSNDYAMCARVYTSDGGQRAFCAPSDLGRSCLGASALICNDDGSTVQAEDGTTIHLPWYQAAIYWARDHGHKRVALDAGTITITNEARVVGLGWPWNEGVGIHVPPGIHLEGSMVYDVAPTIVNVA